MIYDSINDIDEYKWNGWNHNPFTSYHFFKSLENSSVIGSDKGWLPKYYLSDTAAGFFFVKSHSYGEYIFDWQWANAYHEHGISYFPKISSMSPFSPVSTTHFYGDEKEVLKAIEDFYQKTNTSSLHFLYNTQKEKAFLEKEDFKIRESFQYHFINQYNDYNDFLNSLKSKKKKQIIKERASLNEIKINQYTSDELTEEHALSMYDFYCSTIHYKGSIQYLNEDFFRFIFKSMKNNILYIEALKNDRPIAGSLFFYDDKRIYGRYWGCNKEVSNLHFELCYYQGIDFCIQNNLEVFEAGAQGEHKIKRGFTPTKIFSAHKFKNKSFEHAIFEYINKEMKMNEESRKYLSSLLPFKSDQVSLKKDLEEDL